MNNFDDYPPIYELQRNEKFREQQIAYWINKLMDYCAQCNNCKLNLQNYMETYAAANYKPTEELLSTAVAEMESDNKAYQIDSINYIVYAVDFNNTIVSCLGQRQTLEQLKDELKLGYYKEFVEDRHFMELLELGNKQKKWRLENIKGAIFLSAD